MAHATIVDVNPTMFHVLGRPTAYELMEDSLSPLARFDRRWRLAMAKIRHRLRIWKEERELSRIMAALEKLDDDEIALLGLDLAAVDGIVERNRTRRDHSRNW